jgi:hypothetical protein
MRLALIAPLALLALVGGCASEAAPTTTPRPSATTAALQACERLTDGAVWRGWVRAGPGTTTIDGSDDYFTPTCIVVPPNTAISIAVTNRGHVPHTVTIRATGTDMSLDAGQTALVSLPVGITPLRVVCAFHKHEHMVAAIVPDT